jgi:hypothetical protein
MAGFIANLTGKALCDETIAAQRKYYQTAGKEIGKILCESLYNDDEYNLKDQFMYVVSKSLIDTLDDGDEKKAFNETVRNIIFEPLKEYAGNLVNLSTGNDPDNSDSFTARVLLTLFDKSENIIKNRLLNCILIMVSDDKELDANNIIYELKQIIKDELDKSTSIEETDEKALRDEPQTELECPVCPPVFSEKQSKQILEPVNRIDHSIPETTTTPTSDIINELKSTEKELINMFQDIGLKEKLRDLILNCFKELFEKYKDRIYDQIIHKIIDKQTKFIIDTKNIRLQILYLILDSKSDEQLAEENERKKSDEDMISTVMKSLSMKERLPQANTSETFRFGKKIFLSVLDIVLKKYDKQIGEIKSNSELKDPEKQVKIQEVIEKMCNDFMTEFHTTLTLYLAKNHKNTSDKVIDTINSTVNPTGGRKKTLKKYKKRRSQKKRRTRK